MGTRNVRRLQSEKHLSTFGLGLFAAIFYLVGGRSDYNFFIAGFSLYALVQLYFPLCRLEKTHPLSPNNIAIMWFMLQIIIIPLIIMVKGIAYGRLPYTSVEATNYGYLVSLVAFLSYSLTFQFLTINSLHVPKDKISSPSKLPIIYVMVGILGVVLFFGSLENFFAYISDTSNFSAFSFPSDSVGNLEKLRLFLGNVLRPFLGAGIMLFVSQVALERRALSFVRTVITIIILMFVNFNYNRAYTFWPILAVLAAYLKFNIHARRVVLLILAVAGLVVLPLQQQYRVSGLTINDLSDQKVLTTLWNQIDLGEFIQIYGAGPQFIGFLIAQTNYGENLLYGSTLIPSLLYPVPLVSEEFRAKSGVVLYNRAIYASGNSLDQVIPFSGELFINLHFFGVIIGFVVIAIALKWFQKRFEEAENVFEAYSFFLTGAWVAFLIVGSVAVVSQIFLNFLWPIYIYFLLKSNLFRRQELNLNEANLSAKL